MEPLQTALAHAGSDALMKEAKGFLSKLLGPAVEEAGLILQDRVRQYRLGNQIKILSKAKGMLSAAHIDPRAVPLKILLPLLENASLEEQEDLQSKWAALLATAAADAKNALVLPSFTDILRQLSPFEARLLDGIYDSACSKLSRIYDEVDASNLNFLGASSLTHDEIGALHARLALTDTAWVPFKEHIDQEALEGIRQQRTRLAMALDALVRLGVLYRELGVKYRDRYSLSTLGFQFVSACRAPKTSESA